MRCEERGLFPAIGDEIISFPGVIPLVGACTIVVGGARSAERKEHRI